MVTIDYFFSLASPFTYLAGLRLEEIAERHDASIVYRPCDMASIFGQTGGLPPAKRHPSRQIYRLQELKRLSADANMPLTLAPRYWPTDPTAASLAVLTVAGQGGDAGTLAHAFLRACWAEERDIADPETINAILGENGVDVATLPSFEDSRSQFDANTALGLERGVFGAPFYIVGEERFWGQDRLAYLDRCLAALA